MAITVRKSFKLFILTANENFQRKLKPELKIDSIKYVSFNFA